MIKDMSCKDLTALEINQLIDIFSKSFNSINPKKNIEDYISKIENVLIFYENQEAVAFLFYKKILVNNEVLLHMSLSGKISSRRGIQKKLGMFLYFKYVFSLKTIFKNSYFSTISNNPRSYLNMVSISSKYYPDVFSGSNEVSYPDLYKKLPDILGIDNVKVNGIIPDRCSDLGFEVKDSEFDIKTLDTRGKLFLSYIGGDVNHGLLVLVVVKPVVDIPLFFYYQLIKGATRILKLSPRSIIETS